MSILYKQGTDPAADLYKFSEEMKFQRKLTAISLGQGQGPRAEAMMKSAMDRGQWVFFQNCHLSPSWMPSLERLVEQIDPTIVSSTYTILCVHLQYMCMYMYMYIYMYSILSAPFVSIKLEIHNFKKLRV